MFAVACTFSFDIYYISYINCVQNVYIQHPMVFFYFGSKAFVISLKQIILLWLHIKLDVLFIILVKDLWEPKNNKITVSF